MMVRDDRRCWSREGRGGSGRPIALPRLRMSACAAPTTAASRATGTNGQLRQTKAWSRSGKCGSARGAGEVPSGKEISPPVATPPRPVPFPASRTVEQPNRQVAADAAAFLMKSRRVTDGNPGRLTSHRVGGEFNGFHHRPKCELPWHDVVRPRVAPLAGKPEEIALSPGLPASEIDHGRVGAGSIGATLAVGAAEIGDVGRNGRAHRCRAQGPSGAGPGHRATRRRRADGRRRISRRNKGRDGVVRVGAGLAADVNILSLGAQREKGDGGQSMNNDGFHICHLENGRPAGKEPSSYFVKARARPNRPRRPTGFPYE